MPKSAIEIRSIYGEEDIIFLEVYGVWYVFDLPFLKTRDQEVLLVYPNGSFRILQTVDHAAFITPSIN